PRFPGGPGSISPPVTDSRSLGGTKLRVSVWWRGVRSALLGSAGCFGVVVTLVTWGRDPAVYDVYLTPKVYGLLLPSAGALLLYAVRATTAFGGLLRLTALEAILAASILWGFIANPHWLASLAADWFWLSVAAFLLTVVVRQLSNRPQRKADTFGEPTPR